MSGTYRPTDADGEHRLETESPGSADDDPRDPESRATKLAVISLGAAVHAPSSAAQVFAMGL
jgi:hypothetical protein